MRASNYCKGGQRGDWNVSRMFVILIKYLDGAFWVWTLVARENMRDGMSRGIGWSGSGGSDEQMSD